MGIPKRKLNVNLYPEKILGERRQELLEKITKSDTYLPETILHDDMDMGFLEYVNKNFKVVSNNIQIPIINKILTIQRWGEFTQNWSFSNEDGNMELPFVAIIRKPDVQYGTNPSVQRTIPDRYQFHYATVPTWNGSTMGADIYKIPQPIPVDISYEVTIICNRFRDLNKFNKKVLQRFPSRQDYTKVKGHYIPIVLDSIDDTSPMEALDGRRFYMQNYKFTMLGFLIDSDEFEVSPAVSRLFIMSEFQNENANMRKYQNKSLSLTNVNFTGNGTQTLYSVGESIGTLFGVSVNGVLQEKGIHFYHITYTHKITFVTPPPMGALILITYYKGRNNVILDTYGKVIQVDRQVFTYDGSSITFTLSNPISSVISLDINGLVEDENSGYTVGEQSITLLGYPVVGSVITVSYLY
jgi:hypothetical protein